MGTLSLSEILRGKPKILDDDIRIHKTFIEYQEDKMDYIIIEFEVKDGNNQFIHLFKAIKMYRIIKLPDSLKYSTKMMSIQKQIMASFWENNVNFINIIARIEKCGEDAPIGLLQLYGVQGVGKTVEEAKRKADADFAGLTSMIQGSYRTLEFRLLNVKEAEWFREKMSTMKHIQVVTGIPVAKRSGSERSAKGFGNSDTDTASEETTEEFAAGLTDHEFIVMTLTSPVEYEVLENWLTLTSKKQTHWASIMQGSTSMSAGVNIPIMFAANLGSSLGSSDSVSDSTSEGQSLSRSTSHSVGESISHSNAISRGTTTSLSESFGESTGISQSEAQNLSSTIGHTVGSSLSHSQNQSMGTSYNQGISESFNFSEGSSSSQSSGFSNSFSNSQNASFSKSSGINESFSNSISHNISNGTSHSESTGSTLGTNASVSVSSNGSVGIPGVVSVGGSVSGSTGVSASMNQGETIGQTQSISDGMTSGNSKGFSENISHGQTLGTSETQGLTQSSSFSQNQSMSRGSSTTESWGNTFSSGKSTSWGTNTSDSVSNSFGKSISDSWSKGANYSQSSGSGTSYSESSSTSSSQSVTKGITEGEGESWSRSIGRSTGVTNSLSQGFSSSMGVGASLGVSKNYQFIDSEVQNIVELLEFQKLRLKTAIHGGTGAFFTDVYIATETEEAKHAATAAAKSAWYDSNAMTCPLQILQLSEEESQHLLYHFNAFSPCTSKQCDVNMQLEGYKYTTILNANEVTAYTHIIRLTDGGIYADVQNIPELSVPSELKGEIYMGKILSGYRWSIKNGYRTPFDYRIAGESLMHGIFAGGSGSGKTVTALRFVAELANNVRRGPKKKRLRIIALDPKKDWRKLAKFTEPERFRIYSMGDPKQFPLKLNPLKVPYGVDPEFHLDTLIDVFCRAYGLGIRSVTILLDIFKTLYDKHGVFDTEKLSEITSRSANITLADAYNLLNKKKQDKEFGRDKTDAVDKVLDRLGRFAWENGVLYKLYCQKDGMSIDELLGADDVVVLESGKIQSNNMTFIFGFITASIYMYAKYCPNNFLSDDQYETCLIIEEANRILTGNTGEFAGIQGQSVFEEMLDQARSLGLFVFSVTQQPSLMPRSIIANSNLIFAGRMTMAEDIDLILTALGREGRLDDRTIKKFFSKCPTGWFICKSSRTFDYKESEPILVQIDKLDVQEPTDQDLKDIMLLK